MKSNLSLPQKAFFFCWLLYFNAQPNARPRSRPLQENIKKSNIQIFDKERRTRITLITYLISLNGVICCNILWYPAINAPPPPHPPLSICSSRNFRLILPFFFSPPSFPLRHICYFICNKIFWEMAYGSRSASLFRKEWLLGSRTNFEHLADPPPERHTNETVNRSSHFPKIRKPAVLSRPIRIP